MRRFIRHPSDVPIDYSLADKAGKAPNVISLKDVGLGGLCFCCDEPLPIGQVIFLEIPVASPPFRVEGAVAWCRSEDDRYAVGVEFNDEATTFSVRMIEQICHIEHYRKEVRRNERRELSAEAAACEWIDKFAASFPNN